MNIKGYTLANEDKLNRAIFGVVGREGKLFGGVGEGATDEAKLAEYDKLGGLIQKGEYKVKMGAFWDFEKKCPRSKPEVVFELRDLLGNVVEVPEGEEIPIEVKAADIVKKNAKKVKKIKKLEE